MAEFTLNISACGASKDDNEKAQYIVTVEAGVSHGWFGVYADENCKCECPDKKVSPPEPYNLKKCPKPSDQKTIFAYDCETDYEAENEAKQLAHNTTVEGRLSSETGSPPWLKGCKKCRCQLDGPYTIDWSYDDGAPCGSGHTCDRAVFNFGFLEGELDYSGGLNPGSGASGGTIALGTFNLNNAANGGPVKSPTVNISEDQLNQAIFEDEAGNVKLTIYVRPAVEDPHQGISHCVLKNKNKIILLDKCFDQGETTVIICKAEDSEEFGV